MAELLIGVVQLKRISDLLGKVISAADLLTYKIPVDNASEDEDTKAITLSQLLAFLGDGDMLKSVYDTDNSGTVNNSELINGSLFASRWGTITGGIVYSEGTGAIVRIASTTPVLGPGVSVGELQWYTHDADGAHVSGFVKSVSNDNFGRQSDLVFGIPKTISTDATEAMRLTKNGFLGIGLSVPVNQLELSTDSAGKPATNTWTIVSDERIKKDIVLADLQICYDAVKNLPLKRYGWKYYGTDSVPDQNMLGWIAQDVQEIFPKAVNVRKFITKKEEKETLTEAVYEDKELVVNGKLVKYKGLIKEATYKIIKKEESIDDCLDLNADQINKALYGSVQMLMSKVESLEARLLVLEKA